MLGLILNVLRLHSEMTSLPPSSSAVAHTHPASICCCSATPLTAALTVDLNAESETVSRPNLQNSAERLRRALIPATPDPWVACRGPGPARPRPDPGLFNTNSVAFQLFVSSASIQRVPAAEPLLSRGAGREAWEKKEKKEGKFNHFSLVYCHGNPAATFRQ